MNYDDYVLVEFILNAREPVSVQDILAHLVDSIEGYEGDRNRAALTANIQNRLSRIRGCENFSRIIDVTLEGRKYLYKGIRAASNDDIAMGINEACALLMSDKHLNELAPTRLFQGQADYLELVERAKGVVRRHQNLRHIHNNHVSDFLKRMTVIQRGQHLGEPDVDNAVLEVISECILRKKCVSFEYNGKRRVLHPFGLVFRQPKIYLLAVDTKTLAEQGPSKVRPHQYLCNRIHKANVSPHAHQVPDEFDVEDYVRRGRLDALAYADKDSGPRRFKLVLRIKQSGNLIRDLREFPLSRNQQITSEPDTADYFILTATGMHATHLLVEWVMGRLDRVEVVSPKSFRSHIKAKIDAMHQLYNSGSG